MYCTGKSMRIGSLGLGLGLVLLAASIACAQQTGQAGQSSQTGQSGQSGMTQGSQDQGRSTAQQQSQQMDQSQQSQASSQFQPQLERTNRLIGSDVVNKQGDKIAKVEDIVLDSHDRTINYVVLSYGGVLGMGNKLFAVPWSDIQMDSQKKSFIVDASTDQLKSAPGFDKNNWPNMADPAWKQRNDTYYKQNRQGGMSETSTGQSSGMSATDQPATGSQSTRSTRRDRQSGTMQGMSASTSPLTIKYRRISDLIGMSAKNYQGEDLGDLDDVVIDTSQGRVAYGVLTVKSGFLGMGKELALVPWTSIQVQPSSNNLRVNADKQTLDAVAFDAGHFPDLQNKQYTQDIYKRFEATPYWEALGYTPGTEMPSAAEGAQGRDASAWKPDSDYNKKFDAGKVTTVSGTIDSIGTFRPANNAIDGIRLQIKGDDGKIQTVQLGPRPYMDRQDIDFHYGDKVTVTGSTGDINGRSVIIASKIQNGDKTVELRDAQGKPKWNADELTSQMGQQPSSSTPGSQPPSSTQPGTRPPSSTPGQPARPGQSQTPAY
jgi:sporulation protein YlmC with PRC-barrel domain